MTPRPWLALLSVAVLIFAFWVLWTRRLGFDSASAKNVATPDAAGHVTADPSAMAAIAATGTNASTLAGAPGSGVTDAPAAAMFDEERIAFHEELVKAREEIEEYRTRVMAGTIPDGTIDSLRAWALLLYRDSLRVGVGRRPAGDPVARELAEALRTDAAPRIETIQKAGLGTIPETRTTELLSKVAGLNAVPGLDEARWMATEFEHLFKKAKQRSDSHYMSEMKTLMDRSQASVNRKIEYVDRFVRMRDVTLAEYPREYFEQLLQKPALERADQVNVEALLGRIGSLRTP
jgi:hypothetical protein